MNSIAGTCYVLMAIIQFDSWVGYLSCRIIDPAHARGSSSDLGYWSPYSRSRSALELGARDFRSRSSMAVCTVARARARG